MPSTNATEVAAARLLKVDSGRPEQQSMACQSAIPNTKQPAQETVRHLFWADRSASRSRL